ncbi:MAG: arginine repressor [Gammaproteobacteria bacterium]|nr:arginine repressor [Gammaproteobacteria bacterium]
MPITRENRERRQRAIREILQDQPVGRQSELVALLEQQGIPATQSSVSRDLRELGIAKLGEAYAPALTTQPADNPPPPADFVRSVRNAGANLMVIRTAIGAASRVAVYLDRSGWPEIVGTISGDDTVFIATESGAAQQRLTARLRTYFPC